MYFSYIWKRSDRFFVVITASSGIWQIVWLDQFCEWQLLRGGSQSVRVWVFSKISVGLGNGRVGEDRIKR